MCLLLRFLHIAYVLTVVFPLVYSNEFSPEPTVLPFDEECIHGVLDTNTLSCNCTVFYTGDLCDTLTDATKISISVVLLLLAAFILFYLCSHNRNRPNGKLPVQPGQSDDPFINSLDRILHSDSTRQMWIGEKYSSRDSYINSHTTKKERWWRSKTRYASVNTSDTSGYSVLFKQTNDL